MSPRDTLNAEVTAAIVEAEEALATALRAWQRVAILEGELAQAVGSEVERYFAARGLGSATVRVDVLMALHGRSR